MKQNERRIYLIKYLLKDTGNSEMAIPNDGESQIKLLRSLMNIRAPKAVSDEFIIIQGEYLKEEMEKRGTVNGGDISIIRDKMCIWQGDITRLKCGAIVNAANSAMLGCFVPCHKCIDNAIHTYSGVELRLECDQIMKKQGHPEKTGEAKITKAYNLPCDYVIHTVGPVIKGQVSKNDCQMLSQCYKSSIKICDKYNIKSIAFCCISTGEFHFPKELAAEIAIKTVSDGIKNTMIERVIFNVFKDDDKRIYESLLK